MKALIDSPPRTMMEVFKRLPEGTLAELIDNHLHMSPSSKSIHQIVLNEINFHLLTYFKSTESGMVYISPFDVYLDEDATIVQPDLIVILNDRTHILRDGYIFGVPNLIIEVLSPDNRNHDLVTKKALYERHGVPEYCIVEPETRLCQIYSLKNSRYYLKSQETGSFKSLQLNQSISF
jgi:Uma2 family endonuclease